MLYNLQYLNNSCQDLGLNMINVRCQTNFMELDGLSHQSIIGLSQVI